MNKKEKISVLISIVLISLLAIGAVSAADDVAVDDDLGLLAVDEIQAVDDTQINDEIIQEPDIVEETQATEGDSSTPGDDTLRDEPTKTFSQLITDIGTEGNEVTLEGTYKFDSSVDTAYPVIRRDLTINGPATIDGNGATRLLAVTNGATLTLKNLNLINGATNDVTLDTAGVFASGGNLDIQGCTFKNNVAYQHNGAIQVAGGSLIVKDSVFEGNIATKQAAAIWVRNTATAFEVINCTFTDNVARGATAIVDTSCANSKIIDSKFTGSSSANYGGALFLRGANSIVKNTIFDSNKAANGGAIFVYNNAPNCEIDNCTFTKNNASSGGSAIYVTDVDATISNCIFDSNYVPSGPQYGYAGTIYLNANVNPDDGTYINPDMNVAISKCIFVNNSAIRGSAIYSYGSNFVLENSIFLDNIATDEVFSTTVKATDIYLSASFSHHTFEPTNKTAIINNNWFGSTADNYTDGLQTLNETYGMWQGVCNVRLDNWYFLNITETAGSTYYDILVSLNNLYTNSTDEVTQVTDCALPDWNVSLSATKGTVTPTQVTLENGIGNVQYALTAEEGPGTITADALGPKVSKELEGINNIVPGSYTELQSLIDAAEEGATIVLDHRIVYDANYDGADFLGGMSVTKSVTIIGAEGIEISGNHLARIFKVTNNAVLTLKDLTLCEGNADSNRLDAGAIIASNGNLDIQGCTFRHNIASQYGGDIRSAGGYLKVKDSTFASSRANSYAGSIFAQGTGLELTNCTFFDCNSNIAGVIYTVVPNAEISGCTFKNNRASASAAAIMAQGGPLKIKDTVFEANRAGAQSTLVATAAVGGFEVINCTFTDNIANGGVGTIDTQCPNTKIIDSKFTGSSCGAYGGAIRLRGADSVVRNTIFENNHAGYNGGAIYLNAAATNSRIEDCTFKGNTAGQGGSAIYIVDADATVSNCIFDSNSVPSGSESGYQGTVYLTVSQYPSRTVAFSNCIFVNNSAFRGSAITSLYAGFIAENSIFLDNIATDQVNTLGAEARDIFFIPNPDYSNSPIVRNNWFGSTVDNYTNLITFNQTRNSYQGVTNINMTSWYFLDLAATAGESYYDLLISLNNLYNPDTQEVTQDANYNLPDLNVTVSATAGELTPTTAALENGIAHVQYALTAEQGPATVTADVSGIKVSKEIEGISDKVNREVSISTETITVAYPASGSITITASAPGTYTVHVGENEYSAVIETAGGSATVSVPTLAVGNYDVSVTAPETEEYNAVDTGKIATYTVNKGTVTITSANVTVTYPNTNSVTITASAAGEYTVTVGDKTSSAVIAEDGGTATVTVPKLDVGDYGISVSGNAGDNYSPIDTGIINYYHVLAGSINVSGQGTTVTYPDKGTIVITTDVAGAYTIKVGDKTYENVELNAGANDFNVPDELNADDYDIKVSASIPNYEAITDKSIATYTVNKADSTVAVDSISFTYGSSGTATASLTGAETVTATIEGFENAINVNGNVITVSGLPANANAYTMVVTTVPDANHNAVSINVAVTVNKADATVTLTADETEILFGQSATLTADVLPEGATGAVTYYVNDEPMTGNVLSGVDVGTYTVVAKYAGNENYNSADSNIVTITVDQVAPIVSVSADPVKYGVNGDVVVTVTGLNNVPLQGIIVKVKVDGKEYSDITADDGVVHVLIGILPVGEHTITVDTVASGNYAAGHNYDKSLEVIKGDLTITAGTSASSVDYGTEIVFTYDIDNPAGTTTGGKISYIVDGTPIDSSSISTLAAGPHTVVAKYSGDPNFNDAQSEPVSFTVNPVASTVSVDPISFTYGGSATATATLTGAETVTATIEGFENAVNVNGNVITVSGLPANANAYTMVVTTVPDDNHIAASINVEVTVNKADATVALTADKYEITFGESVTLTAIVSPSDATGPITYYVDGVEVESNVLSNLAAGNRIVSAKYAGDDNYNWAAGGPTTIHVNKADSTVSVDPINFAYGASGSATATLTGATGFTATIEGHPEAVAVEGNVITVSGLPAGTYTMVVTTVPDENHNAVSVNVAVTVNKVDSSVTVDPISFTYGGSASAVATLVGATGVTATIEGHDGAVSVDGTTITVSGLPAGTYTMVVTTVPDDNHNAVSANVAVTVTKADPNVVLIADKESIDFGDSVTLNYVLSPAGASGAVTYYLDGEPITGATLSDLAAGTYTVVAKYAGDDNFNAVDSNIVTITVNPVASTVAVDPISFDYGASGSATATLTGATGVTATIEGHDGAVAVEGKVITVSGLPAGTYIMVVTTIPDANHIATSIEVAVTVNKIASTIAIDPISFAYGGSGSATATLTGATGVTASIEGYDGAVAVEGNVITVSGLPSGSYTMVVTTVPDDNHYAVSINVPVGVGKDDATLSLTADNDVINFGDIITLTAVVSPADATGPITYYVDDTAVESNVLSGLAAGTYTVHAMYGGDDNYNAAVSNSISITVNKVASSVTVDPISFTYGESASATATLVGATGVNAVIDGHDGAVSVEGTTITVSGLPAGTYTMVVTTVPDANHTALSAEVTVTVNKAAATVSLSADKETIAFGESVALSSVVSPDGATGAVTYYLDGEPITGDVLSGLAVGPHTVVAKYAGNDNFNAAESAPLTITVNKADASVVLSADKESIAFGESVALSSVVSPDGATGAVTYYLDGEPINGATLSDLTVGTHTVVAKYAGDENYNAADSNAVTITVAPVDSSVTVDPISFTYGGSASAAATLVGATGVTASIEGHDGAVSVEGTTITVSGLPAGTYTMVVTTIPDANHNAVSANVAVTVNKADASVVLSADKESIAFGDSVTLNYVLSPAGATGAVTIYLDGEPITGNVLSDLAAGTYTVVAKYAGDDNFNAADSNAVTITVNKVASSVTVDPISFTYGESASGTATLVGATGLTASIEGHDGAVSVEGTTITVSGLPAGTYTMVVTTVPDANHNAVTANVAVTVAKADATLSLSADKNVIDYGDTVTLSHVLSPEGATGAVTYYLDGEPVTGNVLSGLTVGDYTVVAKYVGNDNYNAADSNAVTISVGKTATTVSLSADKESIAFGESVTLSTAVSPADATGAVTIYLDGEPITGNVLSDLAAGTYTVVAKYAGDANYAPSESAPLTITVSKVDSSVTVDPISFTYGGSASAVATLVGATGVNAAIEGHDGAVSVDGATITVSGLPAGTYTMVVTTIPDANHNAVSTEVTVTVNKADPVLTISANVTSIKYPESIKLSNTITPEDATGSVVYYLDGTAIDGDVLARLAPGVYTVTAKYGGNDNYNEVDSSNSLEITVAKGDVSIEVTAESYTIEYGKDLFISRSLVPADASVAVTYIVDGEEVDYQLISGLSVGTHTIAAKASESVYYNGAVSETKTVTVTKSTSATVTVAPTKEAYDYGEDVVLDVTVKDGETGLTGTVVVNVGGTDYAVEVTDGTGKAVVKGLADGNYDVTAKFLANDNYEEAVAAGAVNFVVNEPTKPVPTLSLTVDPVTIKETESATIKVSLVDGDSNIDGLVIVTIDGTSYAVNVAAGEGSVTVKNLAPDTYTIKGEFIGNDDYAAAFAEDQTLEVTKVAKVSMNVSSAGENLVIKLTDEDNNPVTGKVNVTIDGKTNEVTVNNGVATVPIGAGNHNVTVVYPGDDVHTGTQVVNNIVYVKKSADQKIKTKITVNKNQTITYNKALDNRTKYYVYATLTDINGKILVNKTVSFFAHKKLYVTKTNSKGQFRFCIAHVGAGECTHALTFIGDDDYEASFAVVCVTIKKQKVKLTSKARTFKATKKVKKLTATLKNSKGKAIAGKKITFVVNGKKYTAKTNKKGVATVKVKVTKKKTYKVKVQFAGDKTYAKKTISRKLKIT